jgi:beta-phosphoglucomutase-like phosphatase (HAD superfamily)
MTDPISSKRFSPRWSGDNNFPGSVDQFADHLRRNYAAAFENGITTICALAGVTELLEQLSAHKNFAQGVVTGNFEATARMKLEAAGLACR